MGHIKEPDGIDFVISGKPLTEKEKRQISEFIKVEKKRIAKQKIRNKKAIPKIKVSIP